MTSDSTDSRQAQAAAIVRRLQAAGHAAFWVGGCVRDRLLGREPEDYDIATSARPEEVESLFAHTVPVGRQFGVVLVIAEGCSIQVATFRQEADYADGRRPTTVVFSDARTDAARRDFTINGLFYDPVTGQLHDWVGGLGDLNARIIRTIGRPEERLTEDRLRILRAVRFAAQLGFAFESATFAAVRQLAPSIQRMSAERVRDELLKLFRPPHAARGLDLLRSSGLLTHVLPEVASGIGCAQPSQYHPEGDVYEHVRLVLEHLPADASVALTWAALLHDIGKPPTATPAPSTGTPRFPDHDRVGADLAAVRLERLRFPKRLSEEIVAAVRHHMQFKDVLRMRKSTLRRLLLRPTFPLELALHRLDCLGSHGRLDHYEFLRQQAAELARPPDVRPPLIRGQDLLALGMAPGPALGALLAEVREKQLLDELCTRAEALAWVTERLATPRPRSSATDA
ncbi:MAG: CCA tRNA nucleotidyltransferase [Verrucomicrobia bacterium]|nr:CCA tRNA nucleotidyltransferase [Verrucomicrobiota bacterium]